MKAEIKNAYNVKDKNIKKMNVFLKKQENDRKRKL